ncbi:protein FAM217A-like isoform X2 [Paroedura picta]|uniref:protein FAM217A-like isoform X2 n=2 Tax=Paroedura picta TaxID=143630 RepID=UPI0040572ED7
MALKQKPLRLPKATVVYSSEGGSSSDNNATRPAAEKAQSSRLPIVNSCSTNFYSGKKLLRRFQAEEKDQPGLPDINMGNKTSKSPNVMEKNEIVPGIYGTSLPLNRFTRQTQHNCDPDSDGSAENRLNIPGLKVGSGGLLGSSYFKEHYKAAMEQMTALNVTKNSRTAQLNPNSSKQEANQSWSHTYHQGTNSVSRDFSKHLAEMPSSSSDTPGSFINTNPKRVGSHPVKKYQPVSYPGTQQTKLVKRCRNGDGDVSTKTHEPSASSSYPLTDSGSDETPAVKKLNWKKGNSHKKEKLLAEEKYASEGAKSRAVLLKYLQKSNLNLRPEPIEDIEASYSVEHNTSSYPDFLPSPYNTLDLQKLASSKGDDWKRSVEPPLEKSLDKFISRLVEMERLQNVTILKERKKDSSASPIISNHPGSTKRKLQQKQRRAVDPSRPQPTFNGDVHNGGTRVQETDTSKRTCHNSQNKSNSGQISALHSKHMRASSNKCTKAPVTLDPSSAAAQRSTPCAGNSAKTRTAVKMPPPGTPAVNPLADGESSKCKQPRTKRKSCRNDVSTGKPLNSHRLSVLAKPKHSQADNQ